MFKETLMNSFPASVREEIKAIEGSIDLSAKYQSYQPFEISVEMNALVIPMRIYTNESQLDELRGLSEIQKEIIYCYFSRHCDGFVRARCLKGIIQSNNLFVIPYIVQLLGEYVIEIIEFIYENREQINSSNLIAYINENPRHYEVTRQRVYSYWDCFYRGEYPKYKPRVKFKGKDYRDYPGIKMVKYINTLLLGKML